jgi:hypothetical protein
VIDVLDRADLGANAFLIRMTAAPLRGSVGQSDSGLSMTATELPETPDRCISANFAISQNQNLRTNGFGPEGQARSSRAKTKHDKDAGRPECEADKHRNLTLLRSPRSTTFASSSAMSTTEDEVGRRFAAARAVPGPTERTHSANRKD